MGKLTEHESKLLTEFKELLNDNEKRNMILSADHIAGEIVHMFGHDVAEFVFSYQSGLLNFCNGGSDGDGPSLLSKVGSGCAGGYGGFADEVSGLMLNASEKEVLSLFSNEHLALEKAINNVTEAKKGKWIDHYNKAKLMGGD